MIQVKKEILERMKSRQVRTRLAYEFNRDMRTIGRWIADNDPMLTTPMCVRAVAEELGIKEKEILTAA